MRERIDAIDTAIIELWQERANLSQQVGATRVASGGTRLVLSREREILENSAPRWAPTAPSSRYSSCAPAAGHCRERPREVRP